jgi:hypothetical protein
MTQIKQERSPQESTGETRKENDTVADIKINILKKGDAVLFLNQDIAAVRRKNGEVDVYKLFYDENNLPRIDTENKTTIGYGDGAITVTLDDAVTKITTF